MSDVCVVYYGVRVELGEQDIEPCENRTHRLQIAARKVGLRNYWGNFAGPAERYLLFLGTELGLLGVENSKEIRVDNDRLMQLMADTSRKLVEAGVDEVPALLFQWLHDN
jgi:hypothetical protein